MTHNQIAEKARVLCNEAWKKLSLNETKTWKHITLDSLEPQRVKKTILELLIEKKLDLKRLLGDIQSKLEEPPGENETMNWLEDPDFVLLYVILDRLERSDNLINAVQYLNDSANEFDTHTDELKENFYEIF